MQVPSQMPDVLREPKPGPADAAASGSAAPEGRRGWRTGSRAWVPWALVGVMATVGLVLWLARRPVPLLSAQTLSQARERWQAQKASRYELTIRITSTGLVPYAVHSVVQDGRLIQLEVDGEPASSANPAMYTVEGLFDVLEQELAIQADAGDEASRRGRPVLRAQFDPATGVPLCFLRVVPGSNRSTTWQVTDWQPRPAPPTSQPESRAVPPAPERVRQEARMPEGRQHLTPWTGSAA